MKDECINCGGDTENKIDVGNTSAPCCNKCEDRIVYKKKSGEVVFEETRE